MVQSACHLGDMLSHRTWAHHTPAVPSLYQKALANRGWETQVTASEERCAMAHSSGSSGLLAGCCPLHNRGGAQTAGVPVRFHELLDFST